MPTNTRKRALEASNDVEIIRAFLRAQDPFAVLPIAQALNRLEARLVLHEERIGDAIEICFQDSDAE